MSTWILILFFIGGYDSAAELFWERAPYNVTVDGFASKAACEERGELERRRQRTPDVVFDRYRCHEVKG